MVQRATKRRQIRTGMANKSRGGAGVRNAPNVPGKKATSNAPAKSPSATPAKKAQARAASAATQRATNAGTSSFLGRLGRVAGVVGARVSAVAGILAPSSLGDGTRPEGMRTYRESEGGPARHRSYTPTQGGPARHRSYTPSKGGPARYTSSGSYSPTIKTSSTSTSGATQASTSSSPSVSAAAGVPVPQSKTMKGVQAAAGPKEEKRKSRLKGPRNMDDYRSK